MKDLSGWGRYPRQIGALTAASTLDEAAGVTADGAGLIARGLGRSYGDAAIGRDATLSMTGLDRMQSFDPRTGLLATEAGVSLAEIIDCFLPRGFFPTVVPGTRFVTVGGMIASDVHGKTQHNDGTFGHHVAWLKLALPDGRILRCAPHENPELFHATIGGMGLTGTILSAGFRLKPVQSGWVRQTTHAAKNLKDAIALLRQTKDTTYTVAWIDVLARGDALGRSLILAGEHATQADLPDGYEQFPPTRNGRLGVPVELPGWVLNTASVSAFNAVYYRRGLKKSGRTTLVPWDSYFFPLDGIANWNRIYGTRGFVQHQCVIPNESAEQVLTAILDLLSSRGEGSFLAVLKCLGPGAGLMSFPRDGLTLALDLPVSEKRLALLAEIDLLVAQAGGRIYLAKDACQSRATFSAGYPNIAKFRKIRRDVGVVDKIASKLSERLDL